MVDNNYDPFEYHHDSIHVPHEGKDPTVQVVSLAGDKNVETEIDTDSHLRSLIRLIDRQLNETLVASPFQGVSVAAPSGVYKGRNLYGTQQISGQVKFGGWSIALDNFGNASTSSVLMFLFDGNDPTGVLITCEEIYTASTSSGAGASSLNSNIYTRSVKIYNGLYVAFAAQSPTTMIPNVRGSFFTVQE